MSGWRDDAAGILATLDWIPSGLLSVLILAAAAALAVGAHAAGVALAKALLRTRDAFWRSLVQRTRGPTRLALLTIFLGAAASIAPLSAEQADLIRRVLLFAFILLLGWIGIVALDIAAAIYLRGFRLDVEDNLTARKHLTQVRILRRAGAVLIGMVALAVALMTVPGVKQYGVSLLASAGAAGIILGLALQPILVNLIAGVQIAVTQPIRLDDAVIVEGEWGNVEEITATYVVVRLWDWRRMVLPLTWFIQNPFQNWTRESSRLIGSAFLYVDYAAAVDRLRDRLVEIVRASSHWDGDVVNLQVTDISERTLQIRCIASARSAGAAFDLRCEVREKMVAFLRDELPEAMPRERLNLAPGDPTSDAEGSPSRRRGENHPSG
ncbi:MAG: mechanosensitive ion channel [Caulobacter sp.]|nr:mechanosensitive ion channel [Caulobacter sp.]